MNTVVYVDGGDSDMDGVVVYKDNQKIFDLTGTGHADGDSFED